MQLTFAHKVSKANSVPDTNFSIQHTFGAQRELQAVGPLQLASNAKNILLLV